VEEEFRDLVCLNDCITKFAAGIARRSVILLMSAIELESSAQLSLVNYKRDIMLTTERLGRMNSATEASSAAVFR